MISTSFKILDFGCGFGRHTSHLSRVFCQPVLGVDADVAAVERAVKKYGSDEVHFAVVAPVLPLPFETAQFDVIHSYDVLEHVADPESLLAEFHRILTAEGSLRVEVPAEISERFLAYLRPSYPKEIGHLHIFNKRELVSVVQKANFRVVLFQFRRGIQNFELGLLFLRNRAVSWQQGSTHTPKWILAISLLFQEEMLETALAKIPLLKYARFLALPLDLLFPKSMRIEVKKIALREPEPQVVLPTGHP
jgi:SAM-dependent methyltransferase